tara:strand:- start:139 stop:666 length:528 start_codon:yes stop_codon:yes gene_type:complete
MTVSINGSDGGTAVTTTTQKVLQVVSVEKTDIFSTTSTMPTYADITGLSATITPSSSSSKILVTISVKVSNLTGYFSTQLKRQIGGASFTIVHGGGSSFPSLGGAYARANIEFYLATMQQGGTFLDSPNTTQAVTFKVGAARSTGTCYVNRTGYSVPDALRPGTSSTITLMEVAG